MQQPTHIAIIMDGNGRWASERNQPRRYGHVKGVEVLKEVVKGCTRMGIPCLTVYAFSTENWKRPQMEVDFLMKLLKKTLHNEVEELNENQVRIKIIGRREGLSQDLIEEINYVEDLTADNEGLLFNIALNYGGRAEIVDAVKKIIKQGINDPARIDQDLLSSFLYQPEAGEVEFLIRTGGNQRVSNFLLWQIAYAEIYITEKYWPEFTVEDLQTAIEEFKQRERRFGTINRCGD